MNIKPKREMTINSIKLKEDIKYEKHDKIFLNGFQSWTDSREFNIDEKIPKLNPLAYKKLNAMGDYSFYKYTGKSGILHGWTYTYIRKGKTLDFYGSLSDDSGYTLFEHNTTENRLYIIKECEGLKIDKEYNAFNLYIKTGTEDDVFESYFQNMDIEKPEVEYITGWTSWYNYYTSNNEKIIAQNLEAFSKRNIPIDIFQIDDGYQNAVGDWLITNKKFLKGMKYISDKIKEKGYKAGLWLAPFICEKRSKLYEEHPDWLLKDSKGKPIVVGYNPGWSGNFYALDFYNEDFRNYLKKVFDIVLNDWNYDLVKLDFLYAVSVIPKEGKTRGQIMSEAMQFLRELVGDKLILGCGVPLAQAFGRVEYCRIGCDVGLTWGKEMIPALTKIREALSTEDAVKNTISRRQLNKYAFYNDPDVFILRTKNNKLSKGQKETLFLLNLIFGGLVFTSDNIDEYSEEKLHTYLSHFPVKDKQIIRVEVIEDDLYKIYFEIEERRYLAFANLGNRELRTKLDKGQFFSNKTLEVISGDYEIILSPYASVCLLEIDEDKDFEVLGGKGHIFAGCEVDKFKVKWLGNISLTLHPKAVNNDYVYIKIPDSKNGYKVNGNFINAEKIGKLNVIKVKTMKK
jgi:alpha-galactosidase